MILAPPRSTRTATAIPNTSLFRSVGCQDSRDSICVSALNSICAVKQRPERQLPVSKFRWEWRRKVIVPHRGIAQMCVHDRARERRLGVTSQDRSEEHTSALQSIMRISYAVYCLTTTTLRIIY